MGRSRRFGRKPTKFQAWGTLLTAVTVGLAAKQLWEPMWYCLGILALYLATVRRTRCRVETQAHRPCLWRVRGLFGTCDFHIGYKRGFPTLVRGRGFVGLPTLMWPRDNFVGASAGAPRERQPDAGARGAAATASSAASRSGYDQAMMAFAMLGVAVALVALIRDFIAG